MYQCWFGADWLESSLAEDGLGILVDTKLNTNQQCAFEGNKAISILDCIRNGIASRSREMTFPLLSSGEAPPGALGPLLVFTTRKTWTY